MDWGPKVTGTNVPLWVLGSLRAKRKLKAAEDRAVRARRRRFNKLIDSISDTCRVGKSRKSMMSSYCRIGSPGTLYYRVASTCTRSFGSLLANCSAVKIMESS